MDTIQLYFRCGYKTYTHYLDCQTDTQYKPGIFSVDSYFTMDIRLFYVQRVKELFTAV